MIDEKDLIAIQIANEEEAYNTSLDKYDKELAKKIENGSFIDSKEAILLFRSSLDIVVEYLKEFKTTTMTSPNNRMVRELLFLSYPNYNDLAFMLLRCVISVVIRGENKALRVAKEISAEAQHYLRTSLLTQKDIDLVEKTNRRFNRFSRARRKTQLKSLSSKFINLEVNSERSILLGTIILDIINKSGSNLLTKDQRTDALYIRMSDEAMALLLQSKMFFGSLITVHYPFVVPPRPWTTLLDSGGYYTTKQIKFIRTRSNKDFEFIADKGVKLDRLFKVINTIQETPYRINKRVLSVIDHIDRHSIVDPSSSKKCPCLVGKIPYNDKLNAYEMVDRSLFKEDYKYYRELDLQKELISRIESKRIGFNLSYKIAEKFKKYDKIYFSYNTDFRGRLYPIQQYLSPQGNDTAKAMLEFGNGYKLTEDGWYWLRIHGANCYGYDKLSYKDRIIQIEEKHNEIMAIYSDPIDNIRYWYNADSPLLYLSFCFAYGDYISNPDSLCYAVCQLDGTCSGIQMYSGLLRDKEGAIAVNVVNNEDNTLSDIYGIVAKEVNKLIDDGDYSKELEFTTKGGVHKKVTTLLEAHSIKGKVTRSLTKRNVMTQPYSVTKRGMFEQVYDLLQEYEEENKVFWKGDKWTLSMLLAELNDKAINKVVKGAKEGQRILKEVLAEALKNIDYAYWEAPIFNFPILQRIKKEKRIILTTPLGRLVLYNPINEVHYIRMLNGIAPNFVHSLDAATLYRTVELCSEAGVKEFWLIHDSYGVHPNNVHILNTAFRNAYIDVFNSNPLLSFAKQICPSEEERVNEVMINTLNLEDVRDSKYVIT